MKIIDALFRVCDEYGIKLGKCNSYNSNTIMDYKTKIIANGLVSTQISVEIDLKNLFTDVVIYFPDCDSLVYVEIRIENEDEAYDKILEFFKENDVLTRDEMIIKDIIE